jgi:hypothetical protein
MGDHTRGDTEASNNKFRRDTPRYVLDTSSGLYIPESTEGLQKSELNHSGTFKSSPFHVEVKRDWLPLVLSAATLIGLAGTVYFTGRQWQSTEKAANAATSAATTATETLNKSIEQFRIDERAWIEIDRIEKITIGPVYRYRLYPKNVGKTAAHGIAVNAARGMQGSIHLESDAEGMRRTQDKILLDRTPTGLPKDAVDNPVSRVLAPGTTAVVPFVMDGQRPQIFAKDERVSYLIGRIDYADGFGTQHWMKFCFYVGEGNGQLWNCHEGNDEDRNPEIQPTKKR